MVPKANCGLAVFPAGVLPPTGSRAPDAHHVSKKTGFLLPQSTQCLDGNLRSTQFQTTKPSGLRMPSPSLEFFGQEVHDQYLVVDDDNKKSGEPPDPQSHCLLIEQASELNHGSLLDDYSMLAESTPAEESQGVHGLEVALNVTYSSKNDDPGCNLNCSNVLITQEEAIGASGLKNNILAEKAETKVSSDKPLEETQRIKMNGDICLGRGDLLVNSTLEILEALWTLLLMMDNLVDYQEPQTPSLVVDRGFEENHGLYLNDHLLLGKNTSSEELQEEKVLANVQVAKDQSDVDKSELKSSIACNSRRVHHQASVDSETSNEYDKSSIDTLGTDMVFCGQASSESDSVLMMRDNQTFDVSNTGNRFCMSEESVFLVQKETQANETNIVDIGVDKKYYHAG
ncbi:hypothetical protein Acr_26g0012090 [Actinidia rufa]|uniref:Uncharacterized protein n=1 Tax=Actinidia rufa TaxID=165716 RepID=A0A7J0H4A5_9ERIC|nr:hypothetical protein Acr_26g0012090 [Actinidia rufa]